MAYSEKKKQPIETIPNWHKLVGDDIIKVIVAISHMLVKGEERLSTLSRDMKDT